MQPQPGGGRYRVDLGPHQDGMELTKTFNPRPTQVQERLIPFPSHVSESSSRRVFRRCTALVNGHGAGGRGSARLGDAICVALTD